MQIVSNFSQGSYLRLRHPIRSLMAAGSEKCLFDNIFRFLSCIGILPSFFEKANKFKWVLIVCLSKSRFSGNCTFLTELLDTIASQAFRQKLNTLVKTEALTIVLIQSSF